MHNRMKHVQIDFHFIRDLVVNNKVHVRYTPTTVEQVVDILTKSLGES